MLVEPPRPGSDVVSSGKHHPAHLSIAGQDWRKALGWVIAELLTIKLIFLIGMKILFFSAPNHTLTARAVEARLFPAGGGRVSAVIKEKSHD